MTQVKDARGRLERHSPGISTGLGVLLAGAALIFIAAPVVNAAGVPIATAYEFRHIKWAAIAVVVFIWAIAVLATSRDRVVVVGIDWIVAALLALALVSFIWSSDTESWWVSVRYVLVAGAVYGLSRASGMGFTERLLGSFVPTAMVGFLLATLIWDIRIVASGLGNENFAAEFAVAILALVPVAWLKASKAGRFILVGLFIPLAVYVVFISPANLQYLALGGAAIYLAVAASRDRRWLWARIVSEDEMESLVASLKRSTGRLFANGHVLEAALALQLGQPGRARRALEIARARIRYPDSPNDRANLQNIRSLERSLAAYGAQ